MQSENKIPIRRLFLPARLALSKPRSIVVILVIIATCSGLYILSRYNYPLFHTLVDMGSVFIAASVFVVVWNRRHSLDNSYYLYVGIAFLFFGVLDFIHLVGNKNMGVFPQYGNLGPTLYIASRYVLSVSLIIAPLFIRRKFNVGIVFAIYSVVTILLILSIFYWKNFPVTYIEGVGLTPFKVISDYVVCLILAGAIGLLIINRREFDYGVLRSIIYSLIFSIATGLAFTLYTDPFGLTNAIGHFLQIVSFYLIYRAFVQSVFTNPENILYRNLKQSEAALEVNNERLKILSEANGLLLSSESPESIVQTIANKVMLHLNCDCFFNFIADEGAGKLRLNAYAGIPEETAKGIAWLNYGEAICGCAARDGVRIVSEDIQHNGDVRAALVRSFGVQAYAAHPLTIGLKTIGTLSFGTRTQTRFTEDELDMMKTIAGQVSVAMQRKMHEEYLKLYATELESANKELEAFSYSVSHDLRAPLRSLSGFTQAVAEDYGDKMDASGREYLERIKNASHLMSSLIDDMLKLSRISQAEMQVETVNLSEIVREVLEELRKTQPARAVQTKIEEDVTVQGDKALLQILVQNLVENAWKFTGKSSMAMIEFGVVEKEGKQAFFIKDNGAGFDMKYATKLFQPFQRLHTIQEYPGTGIGLATVQRIINRHGGRIWAEAEIDGGATFHFTLG